MLRVAGKIALVTGGASRPGLGSATAERLAQEGASVIVTDIDWAGAEGVVGDIRSTGGDAIALAHDVTSEADWQRVYATILDRYEGIDIVVNNAGIAVLRVLAETSREQCVVVRRVGRHPRRERLCSQQSRCARLQQVDRARNSAREYPCQHRASRCN
jgi:NAD(P)-dependent dehydrogenase (short-subunit alcohol dehydrogenase family)